MNTMQLEVVNPRCAGIDVGSRSHSVAVGQELSDVREFGVYADDLTEICLWLKEKGITSVAIEESTADPNSYGFRPKRSCFDAIVQCHNVLCQRKSAEWILEADIKGCFDNISHQWILEHIPLNKKVLTQWLKAGYMEKIHWFPTESGTPQGGIISPIIAGYRAFLLVSKVVVT